MENTIMMLYYILINCNIIRFLNIFSEANNWTYSFCNHCVLALRGGIAIFSPINPHSSQEMGLRLKSFQFIFSPFSWTTEIMLEYNLSCIFRSHTIFLGFSCTNPENDSQYYIKIKI